MVVERTSRIRIVFNNLLRANFALGRFFVLLLVLFMFINCGNILFAQIWTQPYQLKKNHTIYLSTLKEFTGCGYFYTQVSSTQGGSGAIMEYQDLANVSNFADFLNDSSWDNLLYLGDFATYNFNNSNLTTDAATSSSPYWFTSTSDNTYVSFGASGCSDQDPPDFPYNDWQPIWYDNSSYPLNYQIDTPFDDTSNAIAWGVPDQAASVAAYIQEQFTDVSTPKTLVLFVAGVNGDPYSLNQNNPTPIFSVLNTYLNSGSNVNKFDLEGFPNTQSGASTYGPMASHKVVVQNLINFLISLNPEAYNNLVIVTHSAGYVMLKTTVLAANGQLYDDLVSENPDSFTFTDANGSSTDANGNSYQNDLLKLFSKANVVSLNPLMGGSTLAKANWITPDLNPGKGFQAWLANEDSNFKNAIASFSAYEVVGDPNMRGVWRMRGDGGYNGFSILAVLNDIGSAASGSLSPDTLETQYYNVDISGVNTSLTEFYPILFPGVTGSGLHIVLIGSKSPVINSIENLIINVQASSPQVKVQVQAQTQALIQSSSTATTLVQSASFAQSDISTKVGKILNSLPKGYKNKTHRISQNLHIIPSTSLTSKADQ